MDKTLITVDVCTSIAEANRVRSLLEAEGLFVFVNDAPKNPIPGIKLPSWVKAWIQVPMDQAERAQAILREYEKTERRDLQPTVPSQKGGGKLRRAVVWWFWMILLTQLAYYAILRMFNH